MRHVASALIATAAAVLLSAALHAQGEYPLTISTSVLPPYSPSIANYFSSSSNVAFVIFNSTTETKRVYLAGSITRIPEEDLSATVDGQQAWSAPPLIVPPGSNYFTGDNLVPILNAINGNPATLVGDGLEDQLRLGVIPEGEYELCLRVYDYDVPGTALSADGCRIFTIRELEPPEPLAPSCQDDGVGEMVTPQDPQFILFNWFLPGGVPPGVTFSYEFRLVRIESPTNAQAALETSTDVVYETSVPTNQLIYTQMMPALEPGRMYAWWVRAVPFPSDAALVRNNGYMRPCTFTYQEHGDTEFGLSFPVQQDTLPWDLIPIMARFEPHAPPNDDLTTGKFWSRLDVYKDGAFLNRTFRHTQTNEIDWGRGYYHSQMELLGNPSDFTEEQARHINIYTNSPDAEGRFKRGSSYALSADLRTKNRAGLDVRYGDAEGIFVSGMGRPRPLTPANNALLPKNGGDTTITGFAPVMLRFQTADEPMALRPPFPIRILYGSNAPTQTHGQAHERWRLEVSRSATMTSPILVRSKVLGPVQLIDDACSDACVKDQFYRLDSVEFAPADTGTYYWRVAWLQDPGSEAGATYHDGPVRMFRVAADTTAPPAEEEVRPRECVSICRAAPTPMAQRVPVTSAAVTDTIAIGLFRMRITEIAWAGGTASGEGLIPVPFMNCPMKVSFTDAQINAQKVMYQGDVYGRYDNESIVPAAWRMGAGLAAGFSPSAVQQIDDYLNAAGRLTMQLTGNSPMGLPIGIAADVPGGRFTVGIVGMQFTDTVAKLNAMMSVPVPELGFNYGLGVTDQVFHPDGVGCPDSDAMLYLVDDVRVGIGGDSLVMKGTRFDPANHMAVVDSGTYAAWDCRGFRALQIDAQWRFDREHLKEDRPDGTSGPEKIVAAMKMRTGRGGLMGRVDFNKPFHIDGAEGWGFDVQEAWLDMASYANPPEMSLEPAVAQHIGLTDAQGAAQAAWRGFYLKRAMLRLPNGVKRFGSTERVSGVVDDLVVNGDGLTASFKLANLLGENEGDLAGWAISLDTLRMDIVQNSFHQTGIKGRIRTSVSSTLLDYSGVFRQSLTNDDHWLEFLVQPQEDLSFPIPFLYSSLELEETSTLTAVIANEGSTTSARAKATLHGRLNLATPETAPVQLNFTGIEFQDLWFSTDAPYTNIDSAVSFSYASPQKYMGVALEEEDAQLSNGGTASGFPVSITEVKGERTTIDGKPAAGIAYDINLQLVDNSNIFRATTRVATLGVLNTSSIHEWGAHEMRLDSIGVEGDNGAVDIHGGLRWYRDSPTYGNGIRGSLRASFWKKKIEVLANAQFGDKSGSRYWYVDAMLAKEGGFNKPSAFTVYGFGGAAWYHMRRNGALPLSTEITAQEIENVGDSLFEPGITLSGMSFTPDASIGLGFQGTIIFGDPSSGYAYNGDATLGAQFSSTGGIETLSLTTNLALLHKREDTGHVPLKGDGSISYDFANDVLAANFNVFVDVKAAETSVLYGNGPQKRAGAIALYIGPENWHLLLGTPSERVGLTAAGFISGGFYFMLGDDLPGIPLPPAELLAHAPPSYFAGRADIGDASGIAFGANLPFSKRDTVVVFRYHIQGEVGFDILFRLSDGMECLNIPDPGIGPFYAEGQAYGYIDASVGIYVDIWLASGEFHLFDVSAGGLFQCGFANPSWLSGFIYGTYDILHGAISGSVTLPFKAGQRCQVPENGMLANLNPIGDLSPEDKDGLPPGCANAALCGVDCGIEPEVVFNLKIDSPFTMQQINSNGSRTTRTFRIVKEAFELKRNGAVLAGTQTFNAAQDHLSMRPSQYLEPLSTHTITIKLRGEERLANGQWAQVMHNNAPVRWERTHTFKTNEGIKELTAGNVDVSYPFLGQRYFLQDECRMGKIICKSDLSNQPVFKTRPGRRRVFKAVFLPINGGTPLEKPATATHFEKSVINFEIPALLNSRTYALRIVARDEIDFGTMEISGDGLASGGSTPQMPGFPGASSSSMPVASVTTNTTSQFNNMVQIRMRSLQGFTLRPDEKLTYLYHFRTSQYNTLAAKAAGIVHSATTATALATIPPREVLDITFGGELFDVYDVRGQPYGGTNNQPAWRAGPLVRMLDPHTDAWFTDWAQPKLYDYYDVLRNSGCTAHRLIRANPDTLGIPPKYTIRFHPTWEPKPPLSTSETSPSPYGAPASAGAIALPGGAPALSYMRMTTGTEVANDYVRLQTLTNLVITNCGPVTAPPNQHDDVYQQMAEPLRSKVMSFQNTSFHRMYRGNYGIELRYGVPLLLCAVIESAPIGGQAAVNDGIAIYNYPSGPEAPRPYIPPGLPGGGGVIKK
ncbi:MAG: hypothetical protein IPK70_00195 [Flavobacteriales bacterium]|jgi:hypothetical protein|nr:hypothetical protein [Flavobacteriales bacterium]